MFILLYHQVSSIPESRDPLRLAVSPTQFAEQMAYLHSNGYTCLPLETIVRAQIAGQALADRAFAITFDDGYQDNYENAWPALKQYGFTATIFLVPDRVGKTTRWQGLTEDQAFPLMDWSAIREMAAGGITFGSHTHTHPKLDLLSPDKVTWELTTSKRTIERELGTSVALFAYPYEVATPRLQREVETAGYLAACGSLLLPENRYNLWRTECFGSDSMSQFQFKISTSWKQQVRLKYHTPVGNFLRTIKRQVKKALNR